MTNNSILLQGAKTSAFDRWLKSENILFSSCLDQSVSNLQVLLIAHAVLAFTVLLCCGGAIPALVCLAWFAYSLNLCKKGGLR